MISSILAGKANAQECAQASGPTNEPVFLAFNLAGGFETMHNLALQARDGSVPTVREANGVGADLRNDFLASYNQDNLTRFGGPLYSRIVVQDDGTRTQTGSRFVQQLENIANAGPNATAETVTANLAKMSHFAVPLRNMDDSGNNVMGFESLFGRLATPGLLATTVSSTDNPRWMTIDHNPMYDPAVVRNFGDVNRLVRAGAMGTNTDLLSSFFTRLRRINGAAFENMDPASLPTGIGNQVSCGLQQVQSNFTMDPTVTDPAQNPAVANFDNDQQLGAALHLLSKGLARGALVSIGGCDNYGAQVANKEQKENQVWGAISRAAHFFATNNIPAFICWGGDGAQSRAPDKIDTVTGLSMGAGDSGARGTIGGMFVGADSRIELARHQLGWVRANSGTVDDSETGKAYSGNSTDAVKLVLWQYLVFAGRDPDKARIDLGLGGLDPKEDLVLKV